MEIVLQILLALTTLICFLGGSNLLMKGTAAYLPKDLPPQLVLDNLFRFTSGIYFGLGFLMLWITFHMKEAGEVIFYMGIVVVISGLGRLYSKTKVGSAGKYFENIMIVEIVLGLAIIILHSLINKTH